MSAFFLVHLNMSSILLGISNLNFSKGTSKLNVTYKGFAETMADLSLFFT